MFWSVIWHRMGTLVWRSFSRSSSKAPAYTYMEYHQNFVYGEEAAFEVLSFVLCTHTIKICASRSHMQFLGLTPPWLPLLPSLKVFLSSLQHVYSCQSSAHMRPPWSIQSQEQEWRVQKAAGWTRPRGSCYWCTHCSRTCTHTPGECSFSVLAFRAWESSPHLPVTPVQLMRPGFGWNTFCVAGDFV